MTLNDIRELLVLADPGVRHYFSMETGKDYTYWEETRRLSLAGDDVHEEGWRFYVHRFTRDEHDPVASTIFRILTFDPRVAFSETVDYEPDTGYIHHIYECEAV